MLKKCWGVVGSCFACHHTNLMMLVCLLVGPSLFSYVERDRGAQRGVVFPPQLHVSNRVEKSCNNLNKSRYNKAIYFPSLSKALSIASNQ